MDSDTWLERAQHDYDAAAFNHDHGYHGIATFRYQQAVEKALKSVLIATGRGLIKTHDCLVLAQRADAPSNVRDAADKVSAFYTRNRYPDEAAVDLTDDLLNRVKDSTATVLEWTKSRLSSND